jgi:hypothetical protein
MQWAQGTLQFGGCPSVSEGDDIAVPILAIYIDAFYATKQAPGLRLIIE